MKVAIHITFWILSAFISHRLLNIDYGESNINYYYTLLFHLPLLLVFYLSNNFLGRLIGKKYYIYSILLLLIILLIGVASHFLILNNLSDLFLPGYYLVSFFSWFEVLQITLLYLAIGCLLFLAFNRFELQEQQSQILNEKNLIQMKSLESKIQPHFLFNSLNNIYSNIDTSNTKARDYLIKLSDSMRYLIYDIDENQVPLSDEVDYLKNYIELEKLRFDDSEDITYDFDNLKDAVMIAPLILIPLVENCFKHVDRNNPKIQISLIVENDILQFSTRNNMDASRNSEDKSGVGLSTLQSRLELLYPDKFVYLYDLKDGQYYSNLKLDLSK